MSLRIFFFEFVNYNNVIKCVRIFIQYGSIEFNILTKILGFFDQVLRILSAYPTLVKGIKLCASILTLVEEYNIKWALF